MSTEADIAVSYDVSNDFFALWLDKAMNYSCALFEDGDDLEQAQLRKLRFFSKGVGAGPGMRILDIGCGWGANAEHLVRDARVDGVTGITLSRAQHDAIVQKAVPGIAVECVDYRNYQPAERFDGAISIGMFEHIATPEQARSGAHVAIYRDYFRRVWTWTKPGSRFGLQSVIGLRVPRNREDVRAIGSQTYTIFPGAITPRIEAIVASVNPYWEVMELHTRREHYEKTSAEWLKRLRSHEPELRERFGDTRFEEYDRYLSTCVMTFHKGYNSLVQILLRRMDDAAGESGKRSEA